VVAEEEMFADVDLAAGADETFPVVGILLELAGEQDLDASVEKIARGRIARAGRLGLETGAASVKACGKDAGVVKNEKVVGTEEIGKVKKFPIVNLAARRRKMKQARGRAVKQGLLRDEFGRKIVIEIGDEHGNRL